MATLVIFFSSHFFLVKTCQDLRMEHHRRAHLSTFVQSQQSGYPFWKCGWRFMIYPLRNWKYQGYAPPFNHQSWTCKTTKKNKPGSRLSRQTSGYLHLWHPWVCTPNPNLFASFSSIFPITQKPFSSTPHLRTAHI